MIEANELKSGETYHYRWIITDPNNGNSWVAEQITLEYARAKGPRTPEGKHDYHKVSGEGDLKVVAITGPDDELTVLVEIDGEVYRLMGEEAEWMINDGAKPGPIPMGPSIPPVDEKHKLPRKK
jgi:hypothetical protein